jgi:hypothetical protein
MLSQDKLVMRDVINHNGKEIKVDVDVDVDVEGEGEGYFAFLFDVDSSNCFSIRSNYHLLEKHCFLNSRVICVFSPPFPNKSQFSSFLRICRQFHHAIEIQFMFLKI